MPSSGTLTVVSSKDRSEDLASLPVEALNQLIANGKYAEVLKRWGLSDEAVPTSEINPQGLPKT